MDGKVSENLAYLDHNVLDSMTKGDPFRVKELLSNAKCTAVFSDENLKEIIRSKGYEPTFLEVLKDIKAQYLIPILDRHFQHTGNAKVRIIDPFKAYDSYVNNVDSMPDFGYGLTGMLQKFYGGLEDTSFKEISDKGSDELKELLQSSINELDKTEVLTQKTKNKFKDIFMQLPDILKAESTKFAAQLDSQNTEPQIHQFEKATGVGPRTLNYIKGPNAVLQVWEHVRKGLQDVELDVELDLETFFGIKPPPWSDQPERQTTILEKVNAIYHQLNFLGYYRDSNMKVKRRFTASFSDMTHAGLASFCRLFVCLDEDLFMKASGAYEYLGVNTKIRYLKS